VHYTGPKDLPADVVGNGKRFGEVAIDPEMVRPLTAQKKESISKL